VFLTMGGPSGLAPNSRYQRLVFRSRPRENQGFRADSRARNCSQNSLEVFALRLASPHYLAAITDGHTIRPASWEVAVAPAITPAEPGLTLGCPPIEAGATRPTRYCLRTKHTCNHQRTSGPRLPSFELLSFIAGAHGLYRPRLGRSAQHPGRRASHVDDAFAHDGAHGRRPLRGQRNPISTASLKFDVGLGVASRYHAWKRQVLPGNTGNAAEMSGVARFSGRIQRP